MKSIFTTVAMVCLCVNVFAQNSYQKKGDSIQVKTAEARNGMVQNPAMKAIRIKGENEIRLDGSLSENVWQTAPVATKFTQRMPNDGESASEQTEIKILYTDKCIFVGIMAYESAIDSISAPLFRRDGEEASDWIFVLFDTTRRETKLCSVLLLRHV
jgi:hypothetical protein